MESQAEILQLLQGQIEKYPSAAETLQSFIDFVKAHEGGQLTDRKNFTGHITASAFIIDEDLNELLLLKHKSLARWLQPGGHVDHTDESLLAAALREAEEETGIASKDLVSVSDKPFDFDSHFIPANRRKQEAQHYHHDTRFLFRSSKEKAVSIAAEESTDSRWIPFSDLENDDEFGKVMRRIKAILSY